MTQIFRFSAVALLSLSLSVSLSAQTKVKKPVTRRSGVVRSIIPATPVALPRERELLVRLGNPNLVPVETLETDAVNAYPQILTQMAETVRSLPHTGFLQVHLKAGTNVEQAILQLSATHAFANIVRAHALSHCSTPNDPLFPQQYGPMNMRMESAWDLWRPLTDATHPIIVASIDTGVMSTHEDLTAKMLRDPSGKVFGYNVVTNKPGDALDDYGHGTPHLRHHGGGD